MTQQNEISFDTRRYENRRSFIYSESYVLEMKNIAKPQTKIPVLFRKLRADSVVKSIDVDTVSLST